MKPLTPDSMLESKDLNISTGFCIPTELYECDKMATITISIPDALKAKLDKHQEINWTEILRNSFTKRVELLKRLEKQYGGEL